MLFEDKDRQVNTQSLSNSTRRFKPGIGSAFKAGAPGEREGGGGIIRTSHRVKFISANLKDFYETNGVHIKKKPIVY